MELAQGADLATFDLAVRRAVGATEAWREALSLDPVASAALAPLARHRHVAGKLAFDALSERSVLPQDAALRDGLRRWVAALTVHRVTEELRADVARVESEAVAHVHLERVETTSYRAAWRGLVAARSLEERGAWIAALEGRGGAVAAVRREYAVHEEEAARRLGFGGMADLLGGESPEALEIAALAFLDETRDLSRSLRREEPRKGAAGAGTFSSLIACAAARDAGDGWPSRLSVRTLTETLGAPSDAGRGLRVQARMPDVLGAASFSRGLESFGEAYRRAAAAASAVPFSLAVDPYFVDAHRFGFAFGALPSSVSYQRRGLGLATRVAAQQARSLAWSALVHARHVALSSLVSRTAARPDAARFQELCHEVYGEGVPPALAGAFPRARGDEHARLHALLTTLAFLRELRDAFEEDWFRNPAAWRFLRARASGPARGPEEKMAPASLARAFEEALA